MSVHKLRRPTRAPKRAASAAHTPIVSSAHLVSPHSAELSEFEFAVNVANNAYRRWITRCMAAAGVKDMSPLEVLVLHHVNHRGRDKKLADICFVLNEEDTHVVSYALKKLVAMEFVASEKRGKEVFFSITDAGEALCRRYRDVRETCLISLLNRDGSENLEIGELARFLRVLGGSYDQAARAASSL